MRSFCRPIASFYYTPGWVFTFSERNIFIERKMKDSMFSCKLEKMKKNRQKWVQVKMEIGTSHKSYLKVILPHLSYQSCWQGSKLMGVEVSDRTISQDSPALQTIEPYPLPLSLASSSSYIHIDRYMQCEHVYIFSL